MSKEFVQELDEIFKGKPFLTVEDVTSLLSCEDTTIQNWCKRSDPQRRPPRIFIGKEVRFPKRDFLRWLASEAAS